MHKKSLVISAIILLSWGILAVFALFQHRETPFPLNDPEAKYFIEAGMVLTYEKDGKRTSLYITSGEETLGFMGSDEEKKRLEKKFGSYVGKQVIVRGEFVEVTHLVECIRAPCPPSKNIEVRIDDIHAVVNPARGKFD